MVPAPGDHFSRHLVCVWKNVLRDRRSGSLGIERTREKARGEEWNVENCFPSIRSLSCIIMSPSLCEISYVFN